MANRNDAASIRGTSNVSVLLGNLARTRCPASSRTDAFGLAPPSAVPCTKISSRLAGTGKPASMRSAASIKYSIAWALPTAPVAGVWMSVRISNAPTRSLPACNRYCDSGRLLAGTFSLASMTLRPQASGAASRIPPNPVKPLTGRSLLPFTGSPWMPRLTGSTSIASGRSRYRRP
ncbi:hypothetical protein D3C72_1599740 [compost metagenome]